MGKRKRSNADDEKIDAEEFQPLSAEPEKPGAPPPKQESPYGKPLKFDPKFKGPVSKRSCTDVICCLIFLVFVVGLVVVAYFAFKFGNPSLLLYPMNSDKELCGFGEQKGKSNLLFYDLVACGKMGPGIFVDGCPTTQICVAECPKENWAYALALNDRTKLQYCKPDIDLTATSKTVDQLIADEDCPAYLLKSKPLPLWAVTL